MRKTRIISKGIKTILACIAFAGFGFSQTQSNFNYTGTAQYFVVPCGVDSVFIEAWGAQGQAGLVGPSGNLGGAGGIGGYAAGWKHVAYGDTLIIFVGGAGLNGTGGFNGGGNGGDNANGAGGGASDVRFGGITEAYRILIAGGGGGGGNAGCTYNFPNPGIGGNGGAGGGGIGIDGADSPTDGGVAGGGKGGNFGGVQGAFGAEGIGCSGFLGYPGNTSNNSLGANGGGGQTCCCYNGNSAPAGGGGGGGFLGGGSGGGGSAGTITCSGNSKGAGGGGGGGSSYIGGVLNGIMSTGQLVGDGVVTITYSIPLPSTPNILTNVLGICAGSSLPVTCSNVNLATNYIWNATGGLTILSGQGTNSILVSSTALGSLTVIAVNAACNLSSAPSSPDTLEFFDLPTITTSVDPNPICEGDSVVFQSQGALSYQWDNGIINSQPILIPASGTFSVTGIDSNGCSNTGSVYLTVNSATQDQINLTGLDSITVNGQTYYQSGTYSQTLQNVNGCDSVLIINLTMNYSGLQHLSMSANVYPNPTTTTLMVKFAQAQFDRYLILNVEGKVVLTGRLEGLSTLIDVQSLKPGIYSIKFNDESSIVRFTKQ